MDQKKKFRISYSLLTMWNRGHVDECVNMYFHREGRVTEAMQEGRKIHAAIASEIEISRTLPSWLSTIKLTNPKAEHKIVVPYNDLFDLSAVIDCLDEPQILEFKTGVSDSADWAQTDQIPFYFLACGLADIAVDRGILIHHNQKTKESDWTQVWNNKSSIARAVNLIDSTAYEVYNYFKTNGLITT